ncbi:MAG: M20 family metallopeptidase [Lachnospiraceae bacterium]|nr:M20 family metallopeptidase [Lachnospiraceae bacterium]
MRLCQKIESFRNGSSKGTKLNEVILNEAKALESEIVENRRQIHAIAEVGMDLPQTVEFVMTKLKEYGYEPQRCGKAGVSATVGNGGKCILLRADMDALPVREESGLPFAATNGNCHACGHDCHPAMLLGAAKILKAHESELEGTVKLMFQPGEEVGLGAQDMIDHGLMENPHVDAAMGIHTAVTFPDSTTGNLKCIRKYYGRFVGSLTITIYGKDAHGAASWRGVDALNIASFLDLALQSIIAREIPSSESSIILTGTMSGGTTSNSVAGKAVMGVTIRAPRPENYEFLVKRICEVAEHIAAAFRGSVEIEKNDMIPAPYNEPSLTEEYAKYATELLGEENVILTDDSLGAGDDFAHVTDVVPGALLNVGFGTREEGYTYGGHNPHVVFNEAALPVGTAVHAYLAMRWLQEHKGE